MKMETIELSKGNDKVLVEPGSPAEAKWKKAGFKPRAEKKAEQAKEE
jgi:hypothetical protein